MHWITIAGHLGTDVEERVTPSGQKLHTFSLAVSIRRKGEDDTVWYRITVWGDRYNKMVPYLKKGSALIVSGELSKPHIYNNRDGQPQVGLEVNAHSMEFPRFGRGGSEQGGGGQVSAAPSPMPQQQQQQMANPYAAQGQGAMSYSAPMDDDLPF